MCIHNNYSLWQEGGDAVLMAPNKNRNLEIIRRARTKAQIEATSTHTKRTN